MNKEKIREEIKKLEKKLKEIKRFNKSSLETHDSELDCGEILQEERKLEIKIIKLQNKLEPTEAYKLLVKTSIEHKYELIFNCGPTVALLLPGIEYDGEDYYWRVFDLECGFYFSSCVGRIDYIKGKIDDGAYKFLFNIFRMNYKRILNRNNKVSSKIKKEIEQILK